MLWKPRVRWLSALCLALLLFLEQGEQVQAAVRRKMRAQGQGGQGPRKRVRLKDLGAFDMRHAPVHIPPSSCLRIGPDFYNQSFSYSDTYSMVNCLVREVTLPLQQRRRRQQQQQQDAQGGASWFVSWPDLRDSSSTEVASEGDGTGSAGPLLRELLTCLSTQPPDRSRRVSYEEVSTGKLPEVRVLAAWWKSEQPPKLAGTVVTFTTFERIHQLKYQCLAWNGPLSVVVYHSIYQAEEGPLSQQNAEDLRRAVLRMMYFATEMERQPVACQLSLLLMYEVASDPRVLPLYPVNAMRNIARVQARTPIAILLDVDLLPSRSLALRLGNETHVQPMLDKMRRQRLLYVLPAFDLANEYALVSWADTLVQAPNKKAMVHLMDVPAVTQFQVKTFVYGHQATDYERWRYAQQDYLVSYAERYEPWVLGLKGGMPWSDERYRGYGKNKIQLIRDMNSTGYAFMVMHDVYIIHRPHTRSAASLRFLEVRYNITPIAGDYTQLHDFIEGIYLDQVAKETAGHSWSAPVGTHVQRCTAKLSWW